MEATKEQPENTATVNTQNVKEESTIDDSSPELSLVEFCTQLDDYTPTVSYIINKSASILLYVLFITQIPDAVTLHYLQTSGFNTDDPRM